MSEENKDLLKFCEYCGNSMERDRIYCPKCGKLAVKLNSSNSIDKEKASIDTTKKLDIPERKCPDCGSLIKSIVLNQCPICNAKLKEIPREQIEKLKKKSGFIFTDKKLIAEKDLIIKSDSWNFKEGISIFKNSILIFVITYLSIIMLYYYFELQEGGVELSIYTIYIDFIPRSLMGIIPLAYFIFNKHLPKKLGFNLNKKKITLAIFIGLFVGLGLYLLNIVYDIFFRDNLFKILSDLGASIFVEKIILNIENTNQIVLSTEIYWILLLGIFIILEAISIEIAFRGTLHNTLKVKFGNDKIQRFKIVLIVALLYTALFSFLNPFYILFNFILNLCLGLIYELTKNLISSIIASVTLNILGLVLFFY